MKKVLFVCSANVFRSLAAELAVRRELGETSSVQVSSGGVFFKRIKPLREDVRSTLNVHGLDPNAHTPREVTPEILANVSLVISMGLDHQEALQTRFRTSSVLFNELALGEPTSVKDLIEVLPEFWKTPDRAREYVVHTIQEIVDCSAAVANAISRII